MWVQAMKLERRPSEGNRGCEKVGEDRAVGHMRHESRKEVRKVWDRGREEEAGKKNSKNKFCFKMS